MASILLIDDDEAVLASITLMLKRDGHAVEGVLDSDAGIESFRERRPDLVITDILMPRREGIETIRILKSIDAAVPIIAISGGSPIRAGVDFLKFARELGASATLEKPFRSAQILALVKDVLAQRRHPAGAAGRSEPGEPGV